MNTMVYAFGDQIPTEHKVLAVIKFGYSLYSREREVRESEREREKIKTFYAAINIVTNHQQVE